MATGNLNLQPSFRGALHAQDQQRAAALAFVHGEGGAVDPSPLLVHRDDAAEEATAARRDAAVDDGDGSEEGAGEGPPREPSPPTWRRPMSSTKAYFDDLSSHFGWRFLSWLAVDQCLISGGAHALMGALGLPLFKELGIGASRQQLYGELIGSPWAMKPFIGVASELFPIGGYNKRYLAVASILMGLVGCSVLLGVYHSGSAEVAKEGGEGAVQSFADVVVMCFTFVSLEAATLDILAEGKYSELMRLHPESGTSIISFKFGWHLLGAMVITSCVGPLSDAGNFHILFWIALVFSVSPLYPTLAGWIPEKVRTSDEVGMKKVFCKGECCLFDKGFFGEKRTVFLVITACGLAAPLTAVVTTYADLAAGLAVSGLIIAIFICATYFIFPRSFFSILLAIILFHLDWISMGSALGYYYTASDTCVPDGPNFDYTFYITVRGIVGSVVNFLGVILYQSTLSKWRFRPVLIFTIGVGSLVSIVDIVIILRWNIKIGIPDKVFFLLGSAVFESLIGVMWSVASSTLFAKIAPPNMESAVFAYAVGISNFSRMVSGLIGSGVIKWSGMKTIGDDCDFEALPYLIFICQIVSPLCIGLPASFLIPNTYQTEHLIDWEKEEGWQSKAEDWGRTSSNDEEESCRVVL